MADTLMFRFVLRTAIASLVSFAAVSAEAADATPIGFEDAWKPKPVVDSAVELDPELVVLDPVTLFSPKLMPLWLKALAQPEADLQRQAADAIARAHRLGMKGLSESVPALVKVLDATDAHPTARLTAARALATLDARQAAPSLFKHLATEGVAYAQVVEPALARWNHAGMRPIWTNRLTDRNVRRGSLRLAIRGLTVVKETNAGATLWALAGDSTVAPQFRLEAARALGELFSEGYFDRAKSLAADKSSQGVVDRIVAASLLQRHTGEPVVKLLRELAIDREPAVSGVALERLLRIDPLLVLPIADRLISRPDAKVRRLAAASLRAHPDPTSIKKLGPLLNDPHPGNRSLIREGLRRFTSKPALDPLVRAEAMRVLQLSDWRGQEQAALLLGQLDHKPAAQRLVTLLESRRPEVMVTTAWALRKLAVPSTLPAMLERARRAWAASRKPREGLSEAYNLQIAQLFQAFGHMKYAPAASFLRQCIPKAAPFGLESRVAGIWALGFLDPGSARVALLRQFSGRLADVASMPPEAEAVRKVCAVSLGRLKAKEEIAALRKFYQNDGPGSPVGLACRWAIREITGETLPGPQPREIFKGNWFLDPLEKPPVAKN